MGNFQREPSSKFSKTRKTPEEGDLTIGNSSSKEAVIIKDAGNRETRGNAARSRKKKHHNSRSEEAEEGSSRELLRIVTKKIHPIARVVATIRMTPTRDWPASCNSRKSRRPGGMIAW